MNDESYTDRSRRTSSARGQASQFDAAEAGGQGPIPETGESRRDNLLAIARNRGLACLVDRGQVKAMFDRTILIKASGKKVGVLLFYPIQRPEDFDDGQAWVNAFWPITGGEANG